MMLRDWLTFWLGWLMGIITVLAVSLIGMMVS